MKVETTTIKAEFARLLEGLTLEEIGVLIWTVITRSDIACPEALHGGTIHRVDELEAIHVAVNELLLIKSHSTCDDPRAKRAYTERAEMLSAYELTVPADKRRYPGMDKDEVLLNFIGDMIANDTKAWWLRFVLKHISTMHKPKLAPGNN